MLFAFHCLDKAGGLEIRKSTRDAHLAYLDASAVVFGGPLLDADGETPIGSLIVVELADMAAAEAWAANDPYAQAGLFDRVDIRAWRRVRG